MEDQDNELERTMEKIKKLLRVAEGKANEHESALALQLAQSLADAYNIDIAGVKDSKPGERGDELFPGGLYPYQRKLYEAIAKLNHCLYWNRKGLLRGEKYKHRLVGSKVNVLLTRQMAQYLQETIERITRNDYCKGDPTCYFKKDAHWFREGMVDRLVEKIHEKRAEEEAERQRRKAEEASRSSHPGYAGTSIITIDDVAERERIANYDYLHGEGAWAKLMAERAERERLQKEAMERYEQWKRDNPEEYARQKAQQAAENERYWREEARRAKRRKGSVSRWTKADEERWQKDNSDAYHSGRERASEVSLDRQVEGGAKGYLS